MNGKDSELFDCSSCRAKTQHQLRNKDNRYPHHSKMLIKTHILTVKRFHLIYECSHCQSNTYILYTGDQEALVSVGSGGTISERLALKGRAVHRYPVMVPVLHKSIPEEVGKAIAEAESCFANQLPNAAATMARLAIEGIVEKIGASGRDLWTKLESLGSSNTLPPHIIEMAHHVRQAGRNGAHAEWEDLDMSAAEDVLLLLREIANELYINPAERQARMSKKFEKK